MMALKPSIQKAYMAYQATHHTRLRLCAGVAQYLPANFSMEKMCTCVEMMNMTGVHGTMCKSVWRQTGTISERRKAPRVLQSARRKAPRVMQSTVRQKVTSTVWAYARIETWRARGKLMRTLRCTHFHLARTSIHVALCEPLHVGSASSAGSRARHGTAHVWHCRHRAMNIRIIGYHHAMILVIGLLLCHGQE